MSGLIVKVRKGERVDKALRRLKKKMNREGIIQGVRERRYFLKPSQKKQIKKKEQRFKNYLRNKREN
jgi:small subunit ribosomal protein S21